VAIGAASAKTRSKQLTYEAGYPDGFTVKALSVPIFDQTAQALAGYLRKVGVNLETSSHTTDIAQQFLSGNWPMNGIQYPLTGDTTQDLAGAFTAEALYNVHKAADPQIDSLLAQAAHAPTEGERTTILPSRPTTAATSSPTSPARPLPQAPPSLWRFDDERPRALAGRSPPARVTAFMTWSA
jgi:ABC-type transport system substrate-binding protein